MLPTRSAASETAPAMSPAEIAAAIEAFLAQHPDAQVLEAGRTIFQMPGAHWTLSTEHRRCILHLWSENANLVRRVASVTLRNGSLRLSTLRLGQTRPQALDLSPAKTVRRSPGSSSRDTTRTRYLQLLHRILLRSFPDETPEAFRSSMDLEHSFGPAYARGILVRGQIAWATIAVNASESQATIDGILTVGILWLDYCRANAGGRRLFSGLRLILPSGSAGTTRSRVAWLDSRAAQWQVFELDEHTENLTPGDPADHGNLTTRLIHAPDLAAAEQRFAEGIAEILDLLPPGTQLQGLDPKPGRDRSRPNPETAALLPTAETRPAAHNTNTPPRNLTPACELRLRSSAELAFLVHGLEFARIRSGYAGQSFNRQLRITVGTGSHETPLTPENRPALRDLVHQLFDRRVAVTRFGGEFSDATDPLFRTAPERWLESALLQDLTALDPDLASAPVYTQVPALTGAGGSLDRGMLDLLAVTHSSRLAIIELKADEDLHLALQGLDYWIRIRAHHLANVDPATGLGELQQEGYFPQTRLSPDPPRLFLVAPALRIHPATETILRYLDPRVDWTLIALDERWRTRIKPVWKKRRNTPERSSIRSKL